MEVSEKPPPRADMAETNGVSTALPGASPRCPGGQDQAPRGFADTPPGRPRVLPPHQGW